MPDDQGQPVDDAQVSEKAAFLASGRQKVIEALAGVKGATEQDLNSLDRRILAAAWALAVHLVGGTDEEAETELPAPRDETRDFIDGKPAPHMVPEAAQAEEQEHAE